MRIARPLRSSGLALALVATVGAAGVQDGSQPAVTGEDKPDARSSIQKAGSPAMERLRQAIEGRKPDQASRQPKPPQPSRPDMRRRAFDGLNRHVRSTPLETRAKATLAASEASMAAAREEMGKRLRQALGLDAPDMGALVGTRSKNDVSTWVPVLFVSSSMPIGTLRNFAIQLERVRGVLAFRGMPRGLHEVGPMAKLAAEILRLDPGCEGPACAMRDVQLIIDPLVFRQHGIGTVPALSMVPGDPTQPYCERDDASPRGAHIVYGDAALSGLLDEYARLGGKEEVRDAQSRLESR